MTMSARTRSCLSAVIMLLAAAMQTEAFVAGPVMAGRRTTVSMSSLNEEASSAQPARSSRWGSSSSRPIGDGFELSVAEKSFTEMLREKKAKGSFFAPSSEAAANADEVASAAAADAVEAAAAIAAATEAAHEANMERQKLAFDDESKPFVAPGSVSTPGSVSPPGGVSNPAAVSTPRVTDPASVSTPSAPAAPAAPPAAPVSSPAAPRVTDPATLAAKAAAPPAAPPAAAAAPVSTPAAPRVTDPATLAAKAAAPPAPPAAAAPVSSPAAAAPAAGAGKKWEPRPDWKSSAGSAAPSRPAVSSPSRPAVSSPAAAAAVSRPASGGAGPAKATFNPKADAPWKASGGGAPAAPPAYAPPAAAAPAYAPPAAAAPAYSPPAAAPKADGEKHIGTGGMADTRDPDALDHADPRKSISAAPSFAEYLKSKQN
ncbi:unnamed protein product [Ectocarpus fasciculatus]